MDCDNLELLAKRGQLAKHWGDPEIAAHVRQCGACESLYGSPEQLGSALAAAALEPAPLDLEALRTDVSAVLAADRGEPFSALRDLPTRARVTLGVAVAALCLSAFAVFARRSDWSTYSASRLWVVLCALVVATVWAVREILAPLTEFPDARRRDAGVAVALALPVIFGLLPAYDPHDVAPAMPLVAVLSCLATGFASALPLGMWLLLTRRSSLTESSSLWLVAAALGTFGNLALQVHCPYDELGHLLAGHAPLAALWAVALTLGHLRNGLSK